MQLISRLACDSAYMCLLRANADVGQHAAEITRKTSLLVIPASAPEGNDQCDCSAASYIIAYAPAAVMSACTCAGHLTCFGSQLVFCTLVLPAHVSHTHAGHIRQRWRPALLGAGSADASSPPAGDDNEWDSMRTRIAGLEQKVDRLESLVDARAAASDAGAGLVLRFMHAMSASRDGMLQAAHARWLVALCCCVTHRQTFTGAAACLLRTCADSDLLHLQRGSASARICLRQPPAQQGRHCSRTVVVNSVQHGGMTLRHAGS